jgi:hypothetical protein
MKKYIIILSLILAGAFCLILVLVGHSDQEILIIGQQRQYNGISVRLEDTIRFPGSLTTMEIGDGFIYGYVNKQKILYRYDLEHRTSDTLLHTRSLFSDILSGVVMDPATVTFYFLSARTNKIFIYQPQNTGKDNPVGRKDSLICGKNNLAGGDKCFNSAGFIIRSVDLATSLTCLRIVDTGQHIDSSLYTFAHFPDEGISADGFFLKERTSKKHFYIPYYNAEIIQFDEAKNKTSKIITIDQTKPFNSAVPTGDGYTISGRSRMINIAAAADSVHLYLLSYTSSPGKNERKGTVVDIYSTITGNYENSLQFPYFEGHPVTLLERSGDRLFVAFDNTILSYKIQKT